MPSRKKTVPLIEGNGAPVMAKHTQTQARHVKPVVGQINGRLQKRTADPTSGIIRMHREPQRTHMGNPRRIAYRMQPDQPQKLGRFLPITGRQQVMSRLPRAIAPDPASAPGR